VSTIAEDICNENERLIVRAQRAYDLNQRCLRAEQAGLHHHQIGKLLGVCTARIWQRIQRAKRRHGQPPLEEILRPEKLTKREARMLHAALSKIRFVEGER
jgi:hypothetical protein